MTPTAALPWWVLPFLTIVFILQVITLARGGLPGSWTIGGAGGDADAKGIDLAQLKASAQTNITVIMVISTIVLAIAAYYFLSQNPNQERPYVMLMLHTSIFVSTISASMAIMNQLSA